MKLLYNGDVTPQDYEPPFLKCCANNEAIKMEMGNVNSKHPVIALKVKSVLDPCDDSNANSEDDIMSLDHESDQDIDSFDTEIRPSEADHYVIAYNDGSCKGQCGIISEDAAHEEELTTQGIEWICSGDVVTVNVSDVLSNFPDISMEMDEGNDGKNNFSMLVGSIVYKVMWRSYLKMVYFPGQSRMIILLTRKWSGCRTI